jgi:ABC-2 type transport system permease protein
MLIEARYIQARLQYRADFIISSVGMAFMNLMGIFVFWVIFHSIPSLAGWNFNELVFIYAFYLISVTPQQVFLDNIWSLRWKVQDGSFIKFYFKPLNMIYASNQLQLEWTLPKLLLLVFVLFSSSLVMSAIMIIAASTAFWFTDSFPMLSLAFKLKEYAPYPVTIFDGAVRSAFTFIIPIGFVAFYPTQLFLRPDQVSPLVWGSVFVGFIAFAFAYWFWDQGVNHWNGTGS